MKGKKKMTAKERTRLHRERLQDDGYKQINVWLSMEAQLALKETIERLKLRGYMPTQSQVICEALLRKPLDDTR